MRGNRPRSPTGAPGRHRLATMPWRVCGDRSVARSPGRLARARPVPDSLPIPRGYSSIPPLVLFYAPARALARVGPILKHYPPGVGNPARRHAGSNPARPRSASPYTAFGTFRRRSRREWNSSAWSNIYIVITVFYKGQGPHELSPRRMTCDTPSPTATWPRTPALSSAWLACSATARSTRQPSTPRPPPPSWLRAARPCRSTLTRPQPRRADG